MVQTQQQFCPYCMAHLNSSGVCPSCGRSPDSFSPSPHHLLPGTVLQDRYMVGGVLGEGGFGITYIGVDLRLEMKIAIKEYYPVSRASRVSTVTQNVSALIGKSAQSYDKGRTKFLDEARTLAKLDKYNTIVSVKDFFQTNNTAYIVMEYVEGLTFTDLVKHRGGKIPPDELFSLIEPLFDALDVVHKAGLIHRDISPDNLMVENGLVRLLDFGCARETENGETHTVTIAVRQGYAPLEQYQQSGQGPWTDIYALCATIYFCLTGIVPPQPFDRIVQDTLMRPTKLGIQITEAQEAALLKGLLPRPTHRFQNARDLHDALYCTDNPNLVPPPIDHSFEKNKVDKDVAHKTHEPLDAPASDTAGVSTPTHSNEVEHRLDDMAGSVADSMKHETLSLENRHGGTMQPIASVGIKQLEAEPETPVSQIKKVDDPPIGHFPETVRIDGSYRPSSDWNTPQKQADHPSTHVGITPPEQAQDFFREENIFSQGVSQFGQFDSGHTILPPQTEITAPDTATTSQENTSEAAEDNTQEKEKNKLLTPIFAGLACLVLVILIVLFVITAKVPSVAGLSLTDAKKQLENASIKNITTVYEDSASHARDQVIRCDDEGKRIMKIKEVSLVISLGEKHSVPNLVGMTSQEASQTLTGLNYVVKEEGAYSEDVPEGVVMEQSPLKNEQLYEGSTVAIIVSLGPAPFELPNLSGKDAEAVANELKKLKLKPEMTHEDSTSVSIGNCIRLEPEAGTMVQRNDTIVIVVSDGTTVPKLSKMTKGEAEAALKSAGLKLGDTDREFSEKVAEDHVCAQSVKAGEHLEPGKSVSITLSKGKGATVPDVCGLSESAARDRLEKAGLKMSVSSNTASTSTQSNGGKVYAQSIDSGSVVDSGVTVTVTLYKYVKPSTPKPPKHHDSGGGGVDVVG